VQHVRANLAAARAEVLTFLEQQQQQQQRRLSSGEVADLRRVVEEAIQGYQELLAGAQDTEKPDLEHSLGRQVIDLKRTAARIPQFSSGTAVKNSADRVPGGGQPFIERRPPPRSITDSSAVRRADAKKVVNPGDEVDAWCGPCNALRSHKVFAVVDGQPKQVICESCGARHGFRLTPARAGKQEEAPKPTQTAYRPRKTAEQQEAERKQKELQRFMEELGEAKEVQPFDPRRRYKGGQYIDHAEFGRGKIENVLRSSILVRFQVGLRSLTTK